MFQEIDGLNTRILQETPPQGILYYKYKPSKEDGDVKAEKSDEEEVKDTMAQGKRQHPILETNDKTKIKIRFSDLPLSRCTQNGLFKSKFIKMTEV